MEFNFHKKGKTFEERPIFFFFTLIGLVGQFRLMVNWDQRGGGGGGNDFNVTGVNFS